MLIALVQNNYHIGNFKKNTESIINAIKSAKEKNAELVVFSELSVCGYPPQDLLEHKSFIENCTQAVEHIKPFCRDIAVIIGAPTINKEKHGKPFYNSAFFIVDGKIEHVVHKTLLPTYDIFDEYRYFESNNTFDIIKYKDTKIALTICEDLWDQQPQDNPLGKKNLYKIAPMEKLKKHDPDVIINIAASPFSYSKTDVKHDIFVSNAVKYGIPLLFVNQVGAHTELIFEGGSLALNKQGELVKKMELFKEDLVVIDSNQLHEKGTIPHKKRGNVIEDIHDALIMGIKDFFSKMNFSDAILGLSGGIDSAIALALTAKAIGNEHVRVLLMPSLHSSDHSINDAVQLSENLGVQYDILSITSIMQAYDETLATLFEGLPQDVTEENIQARIRANLLMAVSNKSGNILLNTSNKSEAAVGYGTLYGDMAGSLSPLGDVYKTDLYKLAHYINSKKEIIPNNIINKPPSAELKPDQKDSDSLPDYELLDKVLYQYIEMQLPENEIIGQGFEPDIVRDIINKINKNEFKRYQAPPVLRVSSKAFGSGRRIPLVGKY
jgi:NAD+ synthase (glutamine-hydrolysing)